MRDKLSEILRVDKGLSTLRIEYPLRAASPRDSRVGKLVTNLGLPVSLQRVSSNPDHTLPHTSSPAYCQPHHLRGSNIKLARSLDNLEIPKGLCSPFSKKLSKKKKLTSKDQPKLAHSKGNKDKDRSRSGSKPAIQFGGSILKVIMANHKPFNVEKDKDKDKDKGKEKEPFIPLSKKLISSLKGEDKSKKKPRHTIAALKTLFLSPDVNKQKIKEQSHRSKVASKNKFKTAGGLGQSVTNLHEPSVKNIRPKSPLGLLDPSLLAKIRMCFDGKDLQASRKSLKENKYIGHSPRKTQGNRFTQGPIYSTAEPQIHTLASFRKKSEPEATVWVSKRSSKGKLLHSRSGSVFKSIDIGADLQKPRVKLSSKLTGLILGKK